MTDPNDLRTAIVDAAVDDDPSWAIELAATACSVRADLEHADPAAWDAWTSLATKLAELRDRARALEALGRRAPAVDRRASPADIIAASVAEMGGAASVDALVRRVDGEPETVRAIVAEMLDRGALRLVGSGPERVVALGAGR